MGRCHSIVILRFEAQAITCYVDPPMRSELSVRVPEAWFEPLLSSSLMWTPNEFRHPYQRH